MSILIKKANKNDIKELIEVQNKSFYDDYVSYGECPAYNESETEMAEYIDTCIVYKIILDNKIVGDIIIRKQENNSYYLRVISIIPECQSLGIGSIAIKFIEKEITDAKVWELITPFKSYRNHHFYEKLGYTKIGEYIHSDVLSLWQYKKIIKP